MKNDSLAQRLAHGIYNRSKKDRYFCTINHDTTEILTLTTKVPLKTAYLADGLKCAVKIGNQSKIKSYHPLIEHVSKDTSTIYG